MSSEEKTIKLEELAEIQTGPFGSQLHQKDYVQKGTPIVTVEHLGNRDFSSQNLPYVSNEDVIRLSKYKLQYGDIVFSRVGSVDRCSFTKLNNVGWLFSGRCLRVRPKSNIDPLYLYYFLSCENTKQFIRNIAVGATMPSINTALMKEIPIHFLSLEQQKKIAIILSSLDNKIELNNAINKNLELQVRAVFSHLFADNESVTPATIADISLNVTDGVHNTVNDDPEGEYLLLSCKNIKGGALSIGANDRRINSETFEKLRRRTKLAKGDVLISSVGTVGELLLLNTEPSNYEFQRSVAIIKPNPEIVSPAYLYEALVYKKAELINAAHGAVQQCLFISDIAGFPIGIPTSKDLQKFDDIVSPMFDKITANEAETIRLSALRDTLVIRLMSGEIDVSKLEI